MSRVPESGNGRPTGYAGAELSVAALFTILWDALADLLGTAATATLLKRAAYRAVARSPELAGLVIRRDGLIYRYSCPPAWNDKSEGTPLALCELVGELRTAPGRDDRPDRHPAPGADSGASRAGPLRLQEERK
jgi:hypothetical protein